MFRIRKVNKKILQRKSSQATLSSILSVLTICRQTNIFTNHRRSQAYRDKRIYGCYQAMYGDFQTYAPPNGYVSQPVDKEKYPDAKQEFRFEKCQFSNDGKWLPEF